MRIGVSAPDPYASQTAPTASPAGGRSGSTPFAAILDAMTTQAAAAPQTSRTSKAAPTDSGTAKEATQLDFTSMTRQELFDWMNSQLRAGKMTLDESTCFLGMTLKISAATGQQVDMATDTTRENFLERARLGIEGALWRHDQDLARRLRDTVDIMLRRQGEAAGV